MGVVGVPDASEDAELIDDGRSEMLIVFFDFLEDEEKNFIFAARLGERNGDFDGEWWWEDARRWCSLNGGRRRREM